MTGRVLSVLSLFVLCSTIASSQQADSIRVASRGSRFIGIIRSNTSGLPVQSADVRISFLDSVHVSKDAAGAQTSDLFVDSTRSRLAATDSAGMFSMRAVTPGHYMVQVRRIGFEPFEAALSLDTATVEMELTMTQVAQVLPRMVVSTEAMTRVAAKLERSGFAYRRKGNGGGTYIERSDVLRQHPLTITDLLRRYMVDGGAAFVLDNIPVDWETLETYPVDLIVGVEIYRHRSSLPQQFNMTRNIATIFGDLGARNAQSIGQTSLMQPTVILWSYVP